MNDPNRQRRQRPAPQTADYQHRVPEIVRFRDLDPQGHVNQAVFSTYFESGRVAMFRTPDLGIGVPGATFVLVRIEIDFMRELRWPGDVEVRTGVTRLGRSSFSVTQAIFRDHACAAAADATLVCIDTGSRKARPIPDVAVERLSRWPYRGASLDAGDDNRH